MKPTPIFVILRRIKPLAPFHQYAHLRELISTLPKRSVRRAELEAALQDLMTRQLKREKRAA